MRALSIFDPALCCSTGVCGPDVDDELVRFAADVDWLRGEGFAVRRHNLAHDAGTFAANAVVRQALQREGTACLPLVLAGGEIVARGRYPSRQELLGWCGEPEGRADPLPEETSERTCCGPGALRLEGSSSRCC